MTVWRVLDHRRSPLEPTFRETLFNLTSIMTGTGFFSGSFATWGGFSLVVAFVIGVIGGLFVVQCRGRCRCSGCR